MKTSWVPICKLRGSNVSLRQTGSIAHCLWGVWCGVAWRVEVSRQNALYRLRFRVPTSEEGMPSSFQRHAKSIIQLRHSQIPTSLYEKPKNEIFPRPRSTFRNHPVPHHTHFQSYSKPDHATPIHLTRRGKHGTSNYPRRPRPTPLSLAPRSLRRPLPPHRHHVQHLLHPHHENPLSNDNGYPRAGPIARHAGCGRIRR